MIGKGLRSGKNHIKDGGIIIFMADEETYDIDRYDYYLPRSLIAQEPARPRSSSRLMVVEPHGKLEHRIFKDITNYFSKGDVLVLNNSRVIPARLPGKKVTGGKAEVLLLRQVDYGQWEALCGGRKLSAGSKIIIGEETSIILKEHLAEGRFLISFDSPFTPKEIMKKYGVPPTPPYIKKRVENPDDYQTIYAKHDGSVAAPTAGLHFEKHILDELKEIGVSILYVTLHVGIGTFQEVKVKDIRQHVMEKEYFEIPPETMEEYNKAVMEGRRIFAVGTTTVRTLESSSSKQGMLEKQSGWANVFIYPGYTFKSPLSGLITNFHIPRSTLLMLVSTFGSYERIKKAYEEAVKEGYRFYSFGDAMLIFKPYGGV